MSTEFFPSFFVRRALPQSPRAAEAGEGRDHRAIAMMRFNLSFLLPLWLCGSMALWLLQLESGGQKHDQPDGSGDKLDRSEVNRRGAILHIVSFMAENDFNFEDDGRYYTELA